MRVPALPRVSPSCGELSVRACPVLATAAARISAPVGEASVHVRSVRAAIFWCNLRW